MTDFYQIFCNTVGEIMDGGPVKATELVTKLTVWFVHLPKDVKGDLKSDAILSTLNEMITKGDLVELDYVLPNMEYRVKSMYFPKGTYITTRKE